MARLIPAIKKSKELTEEFQNRLYTEDMLYLSGAPTGWIPDFGVDKSDDISYVTKKFAVVSEGGCLLGYFTYSIDLLVDRVRKFCIISFYKGNMNYVAEITKQFEKLVKTHHSVEWGCVGGNPVEKAYDAICRKYHGQKLVLHDSMRDEYGKLHDSITYEIINKDIDIRYDNTKEQIQSNSTREQESRIQQA